MPKHAVVVAGALAAKPRLPGEAWVRLTYVLGLRRLGYRVHFAEQMAAGAGAGASLAWFDQVVEAFDVPATLVAEDGSVLRGEPLDDIAASAQLLINISGNLTLEPIFSLFRRRAYLDLDPGYTQLWHLDGRDVGRLDEHHRHFTVATRLGDAACTVPTAGLTWFPTLRPVLLAEWPAVRPPAAARCTTISTWRGGYGRVAQGEVLHGQKAHEFRRFVDLPRRTEIPLEVALEIDAADGGDRLMLEQHGWLLVDPRGIATPDTYRRYIQASSAEFSAVQSIYVDTRCGWFSDRTACYLASGRPAVVQDTNLCDELRSDGGLLTFRDVSEAVAALARVHSDYGSHAAAARALAEERLDSDMVLSRLMADALAG